jgi:hypothetical protein
MYTEVRIKKQQPELFSLFQSCNKRCKFIIEMLHIVKDEGEFIYWLNSYVYWHNEVNYIRRLMLQRYK